VSVYLTVDVELSEDLNFKPLQTTVLYCTVMYCTVLYCTVLYCTVVYCTVLYCTVLYCTAGTGTSVTDGFPQLSALDTPGFGWVFNNIASQHINHLNIGGPAYLSVVVIYLI